MMRSRAVQLLLVLCAATGPLLAQERAPDRADDKAAGADLAAARAATERRDLATALPLFQRLVQRDPVNADLLIEAARVHGWADRNAEAARLYRQALAIAPQRRGDILPSLAWQTLWAEDAAGAAPLFEEWHRTARGAAAAEPLDGLAQARRALGDTEGAIEALREARALRPHDPALARRLAGVLNDAGWHRAALRVLGGSAAAGNEAERTELARTWRWAGYEDRALPLLAGATQSESVWLRDWRVARELVPYGYLSVDQSEDRDNLHSMSTQVGAGWHRGPDALFELNVRRAALSDPTGSPTLTQLQALGRWRRGEPESALGTFWPQLSLRVHRSEGWSAWLPAARVKWIPDDGWRLDAELVRDLVETPSALANRVHVDVAAIGAEWRRDSRVTGAAGLALQRFDDGATRWRGTLRGEFALMQRPRWVLGAEVLQLQRSRDGDPGADSRGYWSPRHYGETRLFTGITHELRPFDLQARLGLGRSRETDGSGTQTDGRPHLWELSAAADLSPALRLSLALGGSGQNGGLGAGGGTGYWRRWANLTANGWF